MIQNILATIVLSVASVPNNCGLATYYDDWYQGRETAMSTADEPNYYDADKLTAASWYYPLGSYVTLTNQNNNRSVTVQVTDRGGNGLFDLSKAASRELSTDGQPDNHYICVKNG